MLRPSHPGFAVAQEGFEPSASLVLSESGLPVAYRAFTERGGSRGTRTHKRPEAASCFQDRSLIQPDGFRSSLLAVKFRGLESNQRPPRSERGVTTTSNCPGFGKEDSNLHRLIQSQGAYPLADSRERPAGVEPAYRAWEARA